MQQSLHDFIDKHSNVASYAHFDYRTSLKNQKTLRYVTNPQKVSHHGFYPFINFTKKQTKYCAELPDHIKYKERELYYAAHLDRCIYQYYAFMLNEKYNDYTAKNGLDECAIAYRNNNPRTNIDCAKAAFDFLSEQKCALVIINDFTGFFDNLKHTYLKQQVAKMLGTDRLPDDFYAVMKNITKFSYLTWEEVVNADGKKLQTPKLRTTMNSKDKILERYQFRKYQKYIHKNPNDYGIPQGSPISAVLANVYMADFDVEMNDFVKTHNGLYMRYSDDTIAVIPLESAQNAPEALAKYNKIIDKYQNIVKVQKEKTETAIYENKEITCRETGKHYLDYLGFRYEAGKILVRPRSITRYHYKLKRAAKHIFNDVKNNHPANYKEIYDKFAEQKQLKDGFGNFVTYLRKAHNIINLENDPAAMKILKLNRMYVRNAIKKYATIIK